MQLRGRKALLACAVVVPVALGSLSARAGATLPQGGPLPTCSVPCISIGDASILEGDGGSRAALFEVTLSQPSSTPVTVQYRIVDGSATGGKHAAGFDFNNLNGATKTLTFPVGANGLTHTSHPVSVGVWGDTTAEPDETFHVLLSNPTGGARLARPYGTGTILDDDSAGAGVHVGVGDASTVEGNSGTGRTLSFPVTLSNPASSPFTLNYTVTSTNAQYEKKATTPGGDYGGKTAGTLNFVVGAHGTPVIKRISVSIWPDTNLEADKTITVAISAASLPAGVTITRAAATGTIIDDDAAPTTSPVPNSMAVLGDSISRGFDACPQFGECVSENWATGTDPAVDSQYSRILAANPAIAGNAFNDAVSGATESNLNGQAANAVSQNVDYITIEMGGNDACKTTADQMTSVATYQAQFQQAMTTITNGLPNARVFVASVPDIEQLWFVGKDSAAARSVWSAFGICQSMLANPQSTAQVDVDRRDAVQQRVIDYNTALASVCAQYANCRFDGNLVYNTQFALKDVSSIDYFHPSQIGQEQLAIGTYAVGWNW